MPVFNAGDYLREAVESILRQTFQDFELIAWDDGSTDDSADVLASFVGTDARIRVYRSLNHGVIATRNKLIAKATAPLIAWMDADDVSLADRLALQIEKIEADPSLVCVGGNVRAIDPEGLPLFEERNPTDHDDIVKVQLKGGGIRFGTTMMRTEAVRAVGGFREPFRIGEDLDLLLRLGEVGRLANLDRHLLLYRQHVRSTCASFAPVWEAYREAILMLAQERLCQDLDRLQKGMVIDLPVPTLSEPMIKPGDIHTRWARQALASGFYRSAWKHAWIALKANPWNVSQWWHSAKVFLRLLSLKRQTRS